MTKIRRRKKIDVLGYLICVEYREKVYRRGKSVSAYIEFDDNKIFIATKGKSEYEIFQSLIHEVLHYIKLILRIPVSDDTEEEVEIDAMAVGVAQLIINNNFISG